MAVLGKDWASFHAHESLEDHLEVCRFQMFEEFVDRELVDMAPASRVLAEALRLSSARLHCYFASK